MQVSDLYIYPIKSCQGIRLSLAEVTLKGFHWDREMMLVDRRGKFLTQRQNPQLATIKVILNEEIISLSVGDRSLTFSPTLNGKSLAVEVWRHQTSSVDQGDEVARWFESILGFPCRLVRQSPDFIRPVDPKYAGNDHTPVSFADGYPILLTNTASLADLNQRLTDKIPMDRFRPNIVVETNQPFIEDTIQKIVIGEINYFLAKPCSRCIITTTHQQTGARHPTMEPFKTLKTFRNFADKIMFGENLIPQQTGIIRIGDRMELFA